MVGPAGPVAGHKNASVVAAAVDAWARAVVALDSGLFDAAVIDLAGAASAAWATSAPIASALAVVELDYYTGTVGYLRSLTGSCIAADDVAAVDAEAAADAGSFATAEVIVADDVAI